jgi:hypothetical protein
MNAVTTLVVRLSSSRRAVVLVLMAFAASLLLLMVAADEFRSASGGADPFDLQNGLSAADVSAQLARYGDDATSHYLVFTVVDWLFPLLGGLVAAVVTAACLRNSLPRVYERAVSWRLFALFFLPTLFDWAENVFAIWLVVDGVPPADRLVDGLLIAKRLKLVALLVVQTATDVAIVAWLVVLVRRKLIGEPGTGTRPSRTVGHTANAADTKGTT